VERNNINARVFKLLQQLELFLVRQSVSADSIELQLPKLRSEIYSILSVDSDITANHTYNPNHNHLPIEYKQVQ